MSRPPARRWTVAQIGHRDHYAAPRALAARGELRCLYTDVWWDRRTRWLAGRPGAGRPGAGRHHPALRDARLRAWNLGASWRLARRRAVAARRPDSLFDQHLRYGRWFDGQVVRRLRRDSLDPAHDVYLGFTSGSLRSLRHLGQTGVTAVVDQIDAGRLHYDIVRQEAERWPGWQTALPSIPEAFFERVAAEWEAASGVIVNSTWSANRLVDQGVPPQRIVTVPLAYETPGDGRPTRPAATGRLEVLWVGRVNLGKGIQYLIEAAKLLQDRPIGFTVIGPVQISDRAAATAPPSVEFRGRLGHDRVSEAYASADVFAFPTLSDGFGLTQLEAMAHGLPVVATPNCGSVVEPGVDGLLVPAGDAESLATALAGLDDDRERLAGLAERAPVKAAQFSLDRYAANLGAAVEHLGQAREDRLGGSTIAEKPGPGP